MNYKPGDRIEITDPPGAGRRGTITGQDPILKGSEWVEILLDGHLKPQIWRPEDFRVLNLLEVIAEAAREDR